MTEFGLVGGIGAAIILFLLIVSISWAALCMVPAIMAEKRGRNKLGWFLLSFFISPVLGACCLFCLGETDEKRESRILNEEGLRESVRHRSAQQESKPTTERRFDSSAKTINDMYKHPV